MKRYILTVAGMGCAVCVKRVTEALAALGCADIAVEIGSAAVSFAGDATALAAAVNDLGFEVTLITEA